MSTKKYAKHLKSKHPKFTAYDPITKKILYSSNSEIEFGDMRKSYRKQLKRDSKNKNDD